MVEEGRQTRLETLGTFAFCHLADGCADAPYGLAVDNEKDASAGSEGLEPEATQAQTSDELVRVCRKCSVQSRGNGNFCPNCGAPYSRNPKRRKRALIASAVIGILVLASVGTVLAVRQHNKSVEADRQARAERRSQQQDAAAQKTQDAAEQEERDSRHAIIKDMQKSITKDARKDVKNDLLDGPILYTQCTPLGGGSTDDLTELTGTFECLAATKENDDGTISGYRYSATATWSEGSYTWHLGD